MKKIYLVDWRNNYGLDCVVIVGENLTPEQAKQTAIEKAGAWVGCISVKEIIIDDSIKLALFYPDNQS